MSVPAHALHLQLLALEVLGVLDRDLDRLAPERRQRSAFRRLAPPAVLRLSHFAVSDIFFHAPFFSIFFF